MDAVFFSQLFFLGALLFILINVAVLYFFKKKMEKVSKEIKGRQ